MTIGHGLSGYLPARMAMCRLADRTALLTLLFNPGDRVRRVRRIVRLTFIGFMPGTADNPSIA